MAEYRVTLYDQYGNLPLVLSPAKVEWTRVVSSIGSVVLTLPFRFTPGLWRRDGRILIERRADNLTTSTLYFLRRYQYALDTQGRWQTQIIGYDPISLLDRRIVAYDAGSSYAQKSGPANDLAKAIVRENLGSLATDATRDLSAYLSVEVDDGQGATVSKGFSRKNVLTVLQEIAQASAIKGTYTAFDVVSSGTAALTFKTYTGQRGFDRRLGNAAGIPAVVLSPERASFVSAVFTVDATDEATAVYAGGQGEGEDREIAFASDQSRIDASPFNRIEFFKDARNTTDSTSLTDEAETALRDSRPKTVFEAQINDGGGAAYGIHYDFGDYITAQVLDARFDCRIEAVSAIVEGNDEKLTIRIRSETTGLF